MIRISELREHLRLPRTRDPDGQEDAYLLGLRHAAVSYIERATGRYFGPLEQVTRLLPGIGTGTLWLPDELAAVAAAPYPTAVNEYPYAGGTATELDGYTVTPPTRLVRTGGSLWLPTLLYEVTYWRGYPVGGLDADDYDDVAEAAAAYLTTHEAYLIGAPPDAQQAVRLIVAHWFTSRLPILSGTISEELPFSLRELLDNRRYLFV